jgi:hypothetical protein
MPAQLPDTARTARPSRPGWSARFAAMSRSRAIYVPVSLLLLAPCHWRFRAITTRWHTSPSPWLWVWPFAFAPCWERLRATVWRFEV